MQDQQNVRRIPIGLVAGVSAALLVGGGGAAWLGWNSITSSTKPPVQTTAQSPQPVQPSSEEKVQIYWLNNVDNKIEVVSSSIILKDADQPSEIL